MPDLGTFSVSLAVRDMAASRAFYERLGFEAIQGEEAEGWLILRNGAAIIGLFHGMFESNLMTFNPPDIRAIQHHLVDHGLDVALQFGMSVEDDAPGTAPESDPGGPAHFTLQDPDGNTLLFGRF